MSSSNSASVETLDFYHNSTSARTSAKATEPRTRPVLVASSQATPIRLQPVSREEALRQAILRTG
ncbi:MAG: hypothetical protein AB8B64_06860 [Granulosicoccus sp.]